MAAKLVIVFCFPGYGFLHDFFKHCHSSSYCNRDKRSYDAHGKETGRVVFFIVIYNPPIAIRMLNVIAQYFMLLKVLAEVGENSLFWAI
jgi:hypothetical protein